MTTEQPSHPTIPQQQQQQQQRAVWVHRHYRNDNARIKCRECYARPLPLGGGDTATCSSALTGAPTDLYGDGGSRTTSSAASSSSTVVLIPDGAFLRRYLRLLEGIVEGWQGRLPRDQRSSPRRRLVLVLLESAAELLDYRNGSPVLGPELGGEGEAEADATPRRREAAAPNERTRIARLVEQYGPSSSGAGDAAVTGTEEDASAAAAAAKVVPFPDLSYRRADTFGTDDFDALGLADPTVVDRARRALIRAGRIFLGNDGQDGNDDGGGETTTARRASRGEVVLLTDDSQVRDEMGTSIDVGGSGDDDQGRRRRRLRAMTCEELIRHLHHHSQQQDPSMDGDDDDPFLHTLTDIKAQCEEEYASRNSDPQRSAMGGSLGDGSASGGGRVPYVSDAEVARGLREGRYFKGKLDVTKDNVKEAYVTASKERVRYYVNDALGNFNCSLHDDAVVVEVLPEAMWGRPVGRRRLVHAQRTAAADDEEDADNNADVDQSADGGDHGSDIPTVPSARVVALQGDGAGGGGGGGGRIRRRRYVATLQPPRSNRGGGGGGGDDPQQQHALVVPMDTRIPKIRIRTRLGSDRIAHKRILVEVDGWDVGSNYPHGHYVRVIGDVGDLETEISCLLIEHGIDLAPFSASALACLPAVEEGSAWHIPEEEIRRRRDLRKTHRIFSVDPPGCQDIDDTMSATTLPNGDIEVGVHIADVTNFVPHNSALDREARVRSTTFYLVDRRFDMLPSLLSSDLCSLHGNVDRLAVSVIWTMSSDLSEVKSCWYGRTVIHNCAAMTYGQAHNILHDDPPEDPNQPPPPPLTAGAPVEENLIPALKVDLAILTRLARKLRKDREEVGGAVDLSSGDRGSELKFVLDENGNPIQVSAKKEMEIHHTIAEMMILANGYVASKIYDEFPETSLLRIHRPVEEDRFDELERTLKAGGMKFDGRSNMALAESLKNAKLGGKYGNIIDSLFQSLATRAMSEAQYICSGAQEEGVGLSHYGLGIDKYTHFTSPIRRYADVVVHRLLLAAVENFGGNSWRRSGIDAKVIDSRPLESLPDSKTMSVLGSDGPRGSEELEGDDLLDSLIEGAAELSLGKVQALDTPPGLSATSANVAKENNEESNNLYDTGLVVKICDRLNHQNRMAKLSSMDCQRLFLSLYFRSNIEVTQGVVIGLRVNGLLVYVPKFDMKGPVFLSDKDGNVQVDPVLVGLPPDAGLPPSSGFGILEQCRLFPDGKCVLNNADDETKRLDLTIPGSKQACSFKLLDVVSVQLSCDTSDSVARIPPPRLHLVSIGQKVVKRGQGNESTVAVTAKSVAQSQRSQRNASSSDRERIPDESKAAELDSMFSVVSSIKIMPHLDAQPRSAGGKKTRKADGRVQSIPGRLIFGGFRNPDTLKATQDAAARSAAEAAEHRRAEHQLISADYDASRRIEREATARAQRLAAEKRNARRSKA